MNGLIKEGRKYAVKCEEENEIVFDIGRKKRDEENIPMVKRRMRLRCAEEPGFRRAS